MKNIVFLTICICFKITLQAQTKRVLYCSNEITNTSITNQEVYKDSVYLSSIKNQKGVEITLFNTTNDTIYLFSSYLKDEYLKSKYLHRLNKRAKQNKLSLLPLTPFLSTRYSDNQIMGEEAIVNRNQIVYDFIVIPPNKMFSRYFSNDELFVSSTTKDIELNKVNLNSKIKFKTVNLDKCEKRKSFEKVIELAVYRDIKILCNADEYYINTSAFNDSANKYEVIRTVL